MRGDQLARQWQVIRAVEASPKKLTVADIARPDEIRDPAEEKPLKSLLQKLGWTFLLWGSELN